MSLDPKIRASLTLPPICAPMFLVTGPALVREACKAGVIGGLPRQNARSLEEFEAWLRRSPRRRPRTVTRIPPRASRLSPSTTPPAWRRTTWPPTPSLIDAARLADQALESAGA